MRKALSAGLSLCLILGLAACGADPASVNYGGDPSEPGIYISYVGDAPDEDFTETSDSETSDSETSTSETETSETSEDNGSSEGVSFSVSEERLYFDTLDRDQNGICDDIFDNYELTMINLWEPWCGPCVSEMPELQKLYENYADKGFLILGAYSETEMEEDVDYILSNCGITYPIIRYTEAFNDYATIYVPTTFFVDRDGHVIDFGVRDEYTEGPSLVGANSYEGWEAYIKAYLER